MTVPLAIQTACTKNRAEEFGFDVWEHFVIPFFYDLLDLRETQKPTVVIGGRGCGKTMLLRYLSHDSVFSVKKPLIEDAELSRIGVYWKADTQFASALKGRGLPDDVWESAFNHKIALVVSAEILRSLDTIARSRYPSLTDNDVGQVTFDSLASFGDEYKGGVHSLAQCLRQKERSLQLWVNNPRNTSLPCPVFLPGCDFIRAVIEEVKEQLPALLNSTYFVYVDEFENLLPVQRRIINTFLKHSERPVIFNIAMKRDPLQITETVGDQSLENVADYRIHDLDGYLLDSSFTLFAAELLFFRFAHFGASSLPITVNQLRDPGALARRREPAYGERVLGAARRVFPGLAHSQLAKRALLESAVSNRVKKEFERAIRSRNSDLRAGEFFRPENEQATIVASSLVHRSNLQLEELLCQLDLLRDGADNRFTGETDWIHNNFIGCLLRLYAPLSKVCPFFAGFDTFIQLARGNLRHFLELCHMSLKRASFKHIEQLVVDVEEQSEAAKQASGVFLSEIRGRGKHGNQLHSFVLTLGSLFAIAHQRPTQSEPEISHFAITGGTSPLSEEEYAFLMEAVKWSVLIEERETKLKDSLQVTDSEWILNPIYAPYFKITYRKRRKLQLTTDEVSVLIRGSYEQRRSLLRRYAERWDVGTQDLDRPLFAHLREGTGHAN